MQTLRICLGLLAFAALAAMGVAVASNLTSSRHSDFYSPGRHQFYVWCAGSGSKTVYQNGLSAYDAQEKLYAAEKAAGQRNCWPMWQGRISS
ncbi:MAG: hypothetical protein JO256_11330 [Alphaproteobacteria bacterium]|nr:hypothetical protein [Alphaproteobacteria bacterium]